MEKSNESPEEDSSDPECVEPSSSTSKNYRPNDKLKSSNFIKKLWNMLNEDSFSSINWDPSGTSFQISDRRKFSQEVLPLYFRHRNVNSFVRLLNMYGFRKIQGDDGSIFENDSANNLRFCHPRFSKGNPQSMMTLRLKFRNESKDKSVDVNSKLNFLKRKIRLTEKKAEELTKENQMLWKKLADAQRASRDQEKTHAKVVQILVSLYSARFPMNVAKKPLLAIETPKKKDRRNPTSVTLREDLAKIMDYLNRQIIEGKFSPAVNTVNSSTTPGPIIADVTDELDTRRDAGLSRKDGEGEPLMKPKQAPLTVQHQNQSADEQRARHFSPSAARIYSSKTYSMQAGNPSYVQSVPSSTSHASDAQMSNTTSDGTLTNRVHSSGLSPMSQSQETDQLQDPASLLYENNLHLFGSNLDQLLSSSSTVNPDDLMEFFPYHSINKQPESSNQQASEASANQRTIRWDSQEPQDGENSPPSSVSYDFIDQNINLDPAIIDLESELPFDFNPDRIPK